MERGAETGARKCEVERKIEIVASGDLFYTLNKVSGLRRLCHNLVFCSRRL
jgi:hypothetical protein